MTPARLIAVFVAVAAVGCSAAEVIPPKPAGYFNDGAAVVSQDAALRFNEQLAQFERETSNQVVVAVYRKMQSDSDLADYAQRVFQAWQIGDKIKRNGVLLLVFIEDRKMRIQTGYGVEGALPDATAFDITERHIKPKFRAGDYEGGLREGVDLIFKALLGEYKGTGKTVAESGAQTRGGVSCLVLFIFVILLLMIARNSRRSRTRGWGYSGAGGPFIGGWGGGGGGWSGGSSSGGGFSGFSGGGGSSGGGGAGSSW